MGKGRKNRLCINIFTALLVLCLTACGTENNSTVMPTATVTATAVPTWMPTESPAPTATDIPLPAATTVPTKKPEPTPLPAVTEPPAPEPTKAEVPFSALERLRALLAENNAYCGVAYLGCAENMEEFLASEAAREYREEFSFLWELPEENFISCGGMEIYCIVPAGETMSVSVYELVYDWESAVIEGTPGTELYHAQQGAPVIIQGNASDIIPNMQVVMTLENGEQKKITPYISLRDGSMAVTGDTEGVYDFTEYPEGFVKEE